jgi:CHAT domain-containing protein
VIEAIRVSREAVAAMPEGHPSYTTHLLRLARFLTESHDAAPELDADDAQLKESLQLYEQAAKGISNAEGKTARGAANFAASLFSVGFGYCKTDPWARALDTYDTGLEYMIHGILRTSDESPSLTPRICRLGAAFRNRYYTSDDPFDLARALFCFVFVLYFCNGFPFERILAGAHFVRSSKDYDQAFEVATFTMALVPRLTTFSINHLDRQETLKVVGGLASNAVLVALKAGKGAAPALMLLEQGHSLLAVSARELVDIANLRRKEPDMYEKFHRLRNDLAMPSQTVSPVFQNEEESEASWIPNFRQQMILEEEMDQTMERIRELPTLERFLLSPSEEDIQETASSGPVVRIISHNVHHGHALIIEKSQMRVLDLPKLTQMELWQHAQKGPSDRQTLEWLWDAVMEPVLNSLGFISPPKKGEKWPHVWWIPTGLLQTLPLHAAGYHTRQTGETVIDRVMSSYSSSLEAIIRGRRSNRELSTDKQNVRSLLVMMDKTPGKSSLPYASLEIDVLRRLFRDASFDPVEPPSRTQDVLEALPTCEIFHFAGHGHANEQDPLKSCLLLEDWKTNQFTVSTLLDLDVREKTPFLAYLSACGTGRIRNHRLRDQSLPLTGAYQLAGFRHVIGTLWEVQDEICVDMAKMTYRGIIEGDMTDESVCRGLHDATRELRDRWVVSERTKESYYRDISDVGSADGDAGHERGQRDFEDYDDDEEGGSGPIHWAPYVHFGV